MSGAELANIINEAALLAVKDNRTQVIQKDLEDSVETVIAGYERKNAVISTKEKLIVSYLSLIHILKVRKEAAAGIGLYCRQREVILISENTDQLLDFFRLLQQLPAAQLSAEHILSLFFEFLLKKHKEEDEYKRQTDGRLQYE